MICLSDGRTQKAKRSAEMEKRVQAISEKVSERLASDFMSCDGEGNLVPKPPTSRCQEKFLVRIKQPVPQTDTGSRVENTKVSERTLVKELGKMTP